MTNTLGIFIDIALIGRSASSLKKMYFQPAADLCTERLVLKGQEAQLSELTQVQFAGLV